MLAPWLELDGAREQVAEWSRLSGLELSRLGTTADAEEITDTAVTQPLVVALSLLAGGALFRRVPVPDAAPVAGHSVGELTAAALAGVVPFDRAVGFAAARGRAMAEACAAEPTGMAAVLGGDPDEVLGELARRGLDAANRNGAGQIVAAGPSAALDALSENRPERTRVTRLPVAGAFHTRFMTPAETTLAEHAQQLSPSAPTRPLLSNADGRTVASGPEVVQRLVAQVTRPVRWDQCMATLASMGVDATVELPPAGTLSGLVRRELKGVTTVALREPSDLDAAAALIAEYSGSPA